MSPIVEEMFYGDCLGYKLEIVEAERLELQYVTDVEFPPTPESLDEKRKEQLARPTLKT